MRHPQGYLTIFDPDVIRPVERDTVQCCHCQRIIAVKAGSGSTVYLLDTIVAGQPITREVPGAMCRLCMHPVCLACEAKGRCIPFEAKLELWERKRAFYRGVGLECT